MGSDWRCFDLAFSLKDGGVVCGPEMLEEIERVDMLFAGN